MHTALCDRASVVAMTPPSTGHTHEHRARRRKWRVGTPLVFAVSGALFMVSAANSEGTDLRPGRTTTLAGLVKVESEHLAGLNSRAQRLTRDIDTLSRSIDDAQVRRAQAAARGVRAPAGLMPVTGEGITVTLSDSPREIRESSEQARNKFVVHQQDIQAVVNAMWDAGATAVTIEGQRVVTTTGIRCAGSTVELNGLYFPEPYVISAVGDPDVLESRLDSDSYVLNYRRESEQADIQIGWAMEREERIEAPAFSGLLAFEHARPLTPAR